MHRKFERVLASAFFCLILFFVSIPSLASANESENVRGSKPNIIFILTDDLGWGDLGVFYQNQSQHNKRHRTPFLDQLAHAGLQMRAHYCPAPVCAPSRSTLLTGVHQGNAIIRDNQFDKELENNHTLGTVLKAAGYTTAMIGKYGLQGGPKDKQQTGNPGDWPGYPTKRGFDLFYGYVSHYAGHLHYPNDPWPAANDRHRGVPNLWHSQGVTHDEVSEQLSGCYTTDLFTARAKKFILDHHSKKSDEPFFLYLAYDTPHAALQVPSMSYPAGGGKDGGLQWLGEPGRMINTAVGKVDSFIHPDYQLSTWDELEKRFATMVRRIDSCVNDLQILLQELQIADNTIVVFTSDNGPHHESYVAGDGWGNGRYQPTSFQSYGPFDGTKRDCWEGGIRMPTLAWWPGKIPTGGIDSSPSQFHDWMATFCELAGTPSPARCDGVSLVPTLLGESSKQKPTTTYIEYLNGGRTPSYEDFDKNRRGKRRKQMQVIRLKGDDGKLYKGVRVDIKSGKDDFEIYEVDSDPDEINNLAANEGPFSRLQSKMKARVLQLRSPNQSAPRPYDDDPIPSSFLPIVNGLDDTYPNGAGFTATAFSTSQEIAYVPSVDSLKSGEAIQANPSNPMNWTIELKQQGNSAWQLVGWLKIEKPGHYQFELESNAPAFLRIHDGHGIDFDRGGQKAAERNLGKGWHPIKINYLVQADDIRSELKIRQISE